MREILYRGKRTDNGEWVYGYYRQQNLNGKSYAYISEQGEYAEEVFLQTVGQYTGLTDKNGTKIFESDITKHRSNYNGNNVIAIVTYTDGCFLAMADKDSGFNISDKLEVIGNIHEGGFDIDKSST